MRQGEFGPTGAQRRTGSTGSRSLIEPDRSHVKSFRKSLPELFWPLSVMFALCVIFFFIAYSPVLSRVVAFFLSGLMFGADAFIVYFAVREYLDAVSYDREAEERRMKKLAEDVMES